LDPVRNLAIGNRIGSHLAYGITVYQGNPKQPDNLSQLIGNYIENIQGSVISGKSGACIYAVSSGGVLIQGNTLVNCNVQTSVQQLAPAAIGVSGVNSTMLPVEIIGNNILDPNYFGIYVVSSTAGANVVGNTVRVSPDNTKGLGAIQVDNANNVNITGNDIDLLSGATSAIGIQIYSNTGVSVNNISLSSNKIVGGDYSCIRAVTDGGASTISDLSITGNSCDGGTTNNISLNLDTVVRGTIVGNRFNGSSPTANLRQHNATLIRYSGNIFSLSGAVGILAQGTNTGSLFDKSNYFTGSVTNSGTGLIIEQYGSAAPGSGTWAVGDRVQQSLPAAGSPKGWICTVAGTPGTWVSEGNL
jgi:hypothetical protein